MEFAPESLKMATAYRECHNSSIPSKMQRVWTQIRLLLGAVCVVSISIAIMATEAV